MAATCAQGAMARLYVEPGAAPHTFDSNSETYEFDYESLQKKPRIIGGKGIRGTRSQHSANTRLGAYEVGGRVAMPVNPIYLDAWLPRILGAAENADSFAVADSLPEFGVLVDKVTETFEYKAGKVGLAIFHGEAGPGDGDPDLLEMILDLTFKDRATGTSVPAVDLSTATNTSAYTHGEAVFTFAGAAREVKEWWVMIDNHLHVRWVNSNTATLICPSDRSVVVRARLPYDTDTEALLLQAAAGATGTIALTNSLNTGLTTTFTFATLQPVAEDPIVRGKTEIDLFIDMHARMTGSTREIVVTNDSVA